MPLQLSFGEATATGPREENQDALRVVTPTAGLAASKGALFAIADGVSQLVCREKLYHGLSRTFAMRRAETAPAGEAIS